MAEVRFYHLQRTSLEQALPRVLEKVLERGWRAIVVAGSAERVEALSQHLWTYDQASFLPHGNERDGSSEDQPIWLTDRIENPNGASVLVLTDGMAGGALIEGFSLTCDLFDGHSEEAVAAARRRWRQVKSAGHVCTYWQQGNRGGWEQKA